MSGGGSYCCMAVCLAHRRDVYICIWCPAHPGPGMCDDKGWVHADGWFCEAMEKAPITAGDLGMDDDEALFAAPFTRLSGPRRPGARRGPAGPGKTTAGKR